MSEKDPDYSPESDMEDHSQKEQIHVSNKPKSKKKSHDGPRTPSVRQPATYAAVHIENLVRPKSECLIRTIDRAHVENIKREMREKQVTKFTLIVANVFTPEMPAIKDLQKARSCRLDVLGGNHTRQAAMELWVETEDKKYALWPCQLYHQLSHEESKALAYLHNRNHEVAKQMTFLDYVRLFRTERVACQKAGVLPESLEYEWKQKLCQMMSLTKRILSANYMAALRISSVGEIVWPYFSSLFTAWDKGEVKGQKKGPMKAYFLANAHHIDDQELIRYVKGMLSGELTPRSFQKICADAGAKNRVSLKRHHKDCLSSDGESDNGVSIRSRSSNDDSDDDNCDSAIEKPMKQRKMKIRSFFTRNNNKDMHKKPETEIEDNKNNFEKEKESLINELAEEKTINKQLQARITDQEEEIVTIKADYAISEQKETNHQEEIAHLKNKLSKLERKERDTSDDLLKARACLSLCKKTEAELREKIQNLVPSSSGENHAKLKYKMNDVVEAQWEDDMWYPATVAHVLKHNMYRVKFLEDSVVCDVSHKALKPVL